MLANPIVNAPVPYGFSTGLVPRNFETHPQGCFAFAPAFPDSELIDESEWEDRLQENRKNKQGLLDLRNANMEALKSLDQDGLGLCWAFSTTKACMYTRALMGQKLTVLSAWYVAGMIKRWRDQGGWGAESLQFVRDIGIPPMSLCPAYKSSYDTPEVKAACADNRVIEWWDGDQSPTKATKQMVSSLLRSVPCVVDLNDMGHSMCAIDIQSIKPLQIIYDNSWGMQGGQQGLYVGQGARARPDGLVIPITMTPSRT